MPFIRDHAFADGKCVWCPVTETGINQAKADGKTPAQCAERWADDPATPRIARAADDFDTIRERLAAIRAQRADGLTYCAHDSAIDWC